ncbi:hypothetical protein H0H92_015250, partial [Tricholoma furcatifolium]
DNDESNDYQSILCTALEGLPNSLSPGGKSPVLRVLASFPSQPPLPHKIPSAQVGPVAVLKIDTFITVTEAFPLNDMIEGLVLSMHGKRSNYVGNTFSPITPETPPRGKRKTRSTRTHPETSTTDSSKILPKGDRVVRPIPRHKSPPSVRKPQQNLSSQIGKVVVDDASPLPIPKPAKKRRGLAPESPAVPLRRSPRLHKSSQPNV